MNDNNRLYTIGDPTPETEHEPDYKQLYFTLFNGVSDSIAQLQDLQRKLEDMYVGN